MEKVDDVRQCPTKMRHFCLSILTDVFHRTGLVYSENPVHDVKYRWGFWDFGSKYPK